MRRLTAASLVIAAVLLAGCGASQPPGGVQPPKSQRIRPSAAVTGPATYEAQGVPQPQRQPKAASGGAAYQDSSKPATGAEATVTGQLEARIVGEKNGAFMGMGAYKCTVEVKNPTARRLTGTLTVTFMNGSKRSKTQPIVRPVDVPANGSITLDFEDKVWSTDSAEVEVETAAAAATTLKAAVVATKNGSVLGLGKFKATIEVSNQSAATKRGMLVVTFTDKGSPVGAPIEREVEVAAGESETFEFLDKHWKTDGVTAEIQPLED